MATYLTRFLSSSCKSTFGRTGFYSSSLLRRTPSRLYSTQSKLGSHLTVGRKAPAPSFLFTVAAVGLGLSTFSSPIRCDAVAVTPDRSSKAPLQVDLSQPPESSVSLYQLSFGTVSGICAGIFIKKGAKAVAWLLGGIFVLLQYLSSASVVRVDWGRVATRFENTFHTQDAGVSQPPTVFALWRRLVNFLTADFQPRASFIAGLVLGLRIG